MKKVFENCQNIVKIVCLTPKETQLSKKIEWNPRKNFDTKIIFLKNHQNIVKIVFLGPKGTKLSKKFERFPEKKFQRNEKNFRK